VRIKLVKILITVIVAFSGLFLLSASSAHAAAWDIGDATYTGNSISVSPATSPSGMFVSNDGTKVYISNFSNQTIYQFSMSSGWDITTLSYDSKSISVSAQGSPDDVALSADGTKMFVLSFYDYTVRQYTLSTPWDISTATYDTVLLALGSANHYDFSVKRDGTKLYSLNDYNNRIQQYTLSSAWDLSSQSAGTNYSYPNLSDGQELVFTVGDNGENMYIGTSNNERIHWFTMSTPWDTSTATYSGSYKSIGSEDAAMRKIFFNPSGTIMLALGQVNDKIYEYSFNDTSAPTVNSLSPVDNATSVSVDANLVITFDESVDVETGNITIKKTSDDTTVETIDVTSVQVTGTGTTTITVNPSVTLGSETEYYVLIDATAFDDAAGNSYAGISSTTAWSFTTADVVNPTTSTLSPVDNATAVSVTANLVIAFDEAVDVETGNIIIYKTSDDSEVESIDVTSGQVTGTGTTTITINPSVTLDGETEYYVLVASTAFDDSSGNSYAGISSTTAWSFTTVDVTNPSASTLSPDDNATDVVISANLVITFSEAVDVETGNIIIKKTSDDTTVETIDVTSGQVTGTGTTTITINPTADLSYGTGYYVQIDATAFDDTSGNSYGGISDTNTWSFTTTSAPSSSNNSGGGGGGALLPNLQLGSSNSKPIVGIGQSKHLGEIIRNITYGAYIRSVATFEAFTSSRTLSSSHTLTIVDLQLSNGLVAFTVASTPQTFSLRPSENKYIDLDSDGINDIKLSYVELIVNEVKLTIESVAFTVPKAQEDVATSETSCPLVFSGNYKLGQKDNEVKRLQEFLNNNGFALAKSGYGSAGKETEYFGTLTQSALKKYQTSMKLGETGELDDKTRAEIGCAKPITASNINIEPKVVRESADAVLTRDLYLGRKGEDVKLLQQLLNRNGFTVAKYGPGSAGNETNFFGVATKSAVIKLQTKYDISPAVGFVGVETRELTNSW
jgi:peptidoglycan hydrolase-like protein with peptidoglycan-binding domain